MIPPANADPRPLRVAVTGIGAVSAWGWGVRVLDSGLRSGETAIRPITRFDHSRQRTHMAGEVPAGPPPSFRRFPGWTGLSFADRFAVFAALEAVARSGLAAPLSGNVGVYFASSTGGLFESECYVDETLRGDRSRLGLLASQQLNGPGDAVARHLRVKGPVETLSSACASGTLAIEAALRALRRGEVDLAIAGGSDSLCRITFSGFNALRAVDDRPCRPFREDRSGLSIGEGCGVLVLEPLGAALARRVDPLAELSGAGSSCDANHMTAPHPEGAGAALAMVRALRDAAVAPERVAFVNAHGTGTALNDSAEWQAIRAVFGERAKTLPVTATKGSVGHLLGAAGAVEAVATVLATVAGEVQPTPGSGPVDPTLGVDLVLGRPRRVVETAAISTNLAFGGANTALVIERWTGA